MDVQKIRDLAQRCRELHRIAIHQEVKEQLHHWAIEFDDEADAMEQVEGGAVGSGGEH